MSSTNNPREHVNGSEKYSQITSEFCVLMLKCLDWSHKVLLVLSNLAYPILVLTNVFLVLHFIESVVFDKPEPDAKFYIPATECQSCYKFISWGWGVYFFGVESGSWPHMGSC